MVVLLQGLLPASFLGGVAGAVAAKTLFEHASGSDLVVRMFVLAGMVLALLVTAIVVMVLTMAVNRVAGRLFRVSYEVRQSDMNG
jgi:uncharacterized membrane protein YsdA (DUF1294 family)